MWSGDETREPGGLGGLTGIRILFVGSGYLFYGTIINDNRLAILTAIVQCHAYYGYHVVFRQSELSSRSSTLAS